ncbi:MAG: hypothetical protein Q8O72_15165 [Bacteroidales bacterium]|nr:hypothetical protein [Bacteroidales bacterium]
MASSIVEDIFLTDTIPPPPDVPGIVSGPAQACQGETMVYSADIPIGCETQWFIDGILQNTSADTMEVYWYESGIFIISIELTCDTTGNANSFLSVQVVGSPDAPAPIEGDTAACNLTESTYSTVIMDGSWCQWKVDGLVQDTDSTILVYYWTGLGLHVVEVSAVNNCGLSEPALQNVTVNEWPMVELGNDPTILYGQSLVLDAGNPGSAYDWSTGEITQTIEVSTAGEYKVVVSNACDKAEDSIFVDVLVGVDEKYTGTELYVQNLGDIIKIEAPLTEITRIEIWDLQGRLIIDSPPKSSYFLPGKGLFIIHALTRDHRVLKTKLSKPPL